MASLSNCVRINQHKNTAIASLDQNDDAALIKELKCAVNELKTTCKVTQQEAFDYFEEFKHMPKWRKIVKKQYDTVLYINLKGKKQTNKACGHIFDTLEPCYIQVMLSLTTQNDVEATTGTELTQSKFLRISTPSFSSKG